MTALDGAAYGDALRLRNEVGRPVTYQTDEIVIRGKDGSERVLVPSPGGFKDSTPEERRLRLVKKGA